MSLRSYQWEWSSHWWENWKKKTSYLSSKICTTVWQKKSLQNSRYCHNLFLKKWFSSSSVVLNIGRFPLKVPVCISTTIQWWMEKHYSEKRGKPQELCTNVGKLLTGNFQLNSTSPFPNLTLLRVSRNFPKKISVFNPVSKVWAWKMIDQGRLTTSNEYIKFLSQGKKPFLGLK